MKVMPKRRTAVLFCICLLGATLPAKCAEPQERMAELDKAFRSRALAVVPNDYSSVDFKKIQGQMVQIAREVYGPRASDVCAEAKRLLAALPAADKDATAGYVERTPGKPFVFDDKKSDKAEKARVEEAAVYRMRTWNPSAAANFAVTMLFSRSMSRREFGAYRAFAAYIPDEVYRLGGTADEPELLVKSLNDIFIVRLKLHASGGYLPVHARWLVKKGE